MSTYNEYFEIGQTKMKSYPFNCETCGFTKGVANSLHLISFLKLKKCLFYVYGCFFFKYVSMLILDLAPKEPREMSDP